MNLFDRILKSRGLDSKSAESFFMPEYGGHDPFLLPDMDRAIRRLETAHAKQEKIFIYGDYDIDGLTATTLLSDALGSFGFGRVEVFIPNRFTDGYGMTEEAVEKIVSLGANLIITVDCGSLSEKEIIRAKELGVDVIVTDHHNVAEIQPPAVAVINPKRSDHKYPFVDLAGVGVAFKLVQAMQKAGFKGLELGQEKWLLDLVALGTVCDVVNLVDENRANVFWGLKVMQKTKRPGLRALMSVARVEPQNLNARSLGFALGPRLNAAGRLETAQHSLDLLLSEDIDEAIKIAEKLDQINSQRRSDQDKIFEAAKKQAEKHAGDPVLVLSGADWNHGIVGIVAAKILEIYKKPTFILQEMGKESKGSARSFGDFSAADAIKFTKNLITKGGGHKLAAGVTLPTKNIGAFRAGVNEYYKSCQLQDQASLLLPLADAEAQLIEIDKDLVDQLNKLEPFGNGNLAPVIKTSMARVTEVQLMGAQSQHIKITFKDKSDVIIKMVAFSAAENYPIQQGETVDIWYEPMINEWNGYVNVEGRLLHLEKIDVSSVD